MRPVCVLLFVCGLTWLTSCSQSTPDSPSQGGRESSTAQTSATGTATTGRQQTGPAGAASPSAGDDLQEPLAIFERRILPILNAPEPSSCAECHLSGVDLKDYIRPDQAQTFAALRERGLIDTSDPEKSKILEFIRRRPETTSLVTEQARQQEYEAFRAWILAAVRDPDLTAAGAAEAAIGSELPPEVIRHARRDRVLASFIDNVWSEAGRCAACHSPDRNQEQVGKHGEQVSWIKPGDPEATLRYMVEASLIDTESPEDSLLLAKPTLQVEHGGGQKLVVGDRTYKQFRRFIEDYAAVVRGTYASAAELPAPSDEVSAVSDIWLKFTDVPSHYDQRLLQVDVYRADGDGRSKDRWATADRLVAGDRQLWQQHLSLTAPCGSTRADEIRKAQVLPPGTYLLRVYIDVDGKLQKQYPAELGEMEFVGEATVESRWPSGYGQMTVVRFPAAGQ